MGILITLAVLTFVVGVIAALTSKEEKWSVFGTVVGGVGTALAVGFGVWSFLANVELQREVTALTLYREHLDTSMDNPLLARASCIAQTAEEAARLRDEYSWYVAHGLHSFEAILEAIENADLDDQEEWRSVAEEFVGVHRCYFESRDYVEGHYDESLRDIVRVVLENGPTDTDNPWKARALEGSCIPKYEVLKKDRPWCQGADVVQAPKPTS
jgi:hypothetical protein